MMKPLFMWAGGKSRMIKYLDPYIPKSFTTYYEPFFGGGAMFVHVLKRNPRYVYINDINQGIMEIYRSIRDHPAEFIQIVTQHEQIYLAYTKDDRWKYFMKVRTEHAFDYLKWNKVQESATLFFLIKTGFNGIWQVNKNTGGRYGTPPGLLNQTDSIFDRSLINKWHQALQGVIISAVSWDKIVYYGKDTFVYFDPPYRGSFTTYGESFGDNETMALLQIAETLVQNNAHVIVSNRDMDDGFWQNNTPASMQIARVPITYTAGRRKQTDAGYEAKKATEVIIYG